MKQLLKYEFRRGLAGMATLGALLLAMEAYFLAALHFDSELHLVLSIVLLYLTACAAGAYVFARGVMSYSREISGKAGYLSFMTPNPPVKILAAKYLYTFLHAFLFAALIGALAFFDTDLAMRHFGEARSLLTMVRIYLTQSGVPVAEWILVALLMGTGMFLSLLALVSIAWLAVTFSHTLLSGRSSRGFVSILLFIALMAAFYVVEVRLMRAPLEAFLTETVPLETAAEQLNFSVRLLSPGLIEDLAVIGLTLWGCSIMLERKVNL